MASDCPWRFPQEFHGWLAGRVERGSLGAGSPAPGSGEAIKIAEIDYFRNETMFMLYEASSNLNAAESLGPSLELAGAYAALGLICGFIPLPGLAENYMRLSLATIEAGNQPAEIGEIYEYYGIYKAGAGQLEAANKAFQYAVDAFERIGDKRLWEENATLLSMVLIAIR